MKTNKTIEIVQLTTLNTKTMKKILLLLLFVSGFAFAQPSINNPSPYRVCDDNTNGFAAFDFNVITPTIITQAGTLVSYHLTLSDSQSATNAINLSVPFTNTIPFNQTIYIRAWDVADPGTPSLTTLSLIVSQKPTVSISNNINCVGNPITVTTTPSPSGSYSYLYNTPIGVPDPGNVASFATTIEGSYFVTVTDNVTGCVSNQAGTYVYFTPLPVVTLSATSICDSNPALVSTTVNSSNSLTYAWTVPSGANDPAGSPNFLTAVEGTYAVIVTDNGTGCTSTQYSTIVTNQVSVTPTFSIPPSVCAGYILPTNSDNGISGTWSPAFLATDTYLFTPSFGQCATIYSTFITVTAGVNTSQAPDMIQNSATNNAIFDLTTQNALINSDSGLQFDYFPSLADAENNTNLIATPTAYTNTSSPQTIGVRVYNLSSPDCAGITSFKIVVNNLNNVYIPDANFKARLIALGVDTNVDGEIQFSEAGAFTSDLNANAAVIADLTGIEAFTNLTVLRCNNNSLTSLNVNALTNLINLDCSYNQISALNLSNLTNLMILNCSSNLLTALDVTSLTVLEELNFSINQLTAINVNSLANLKTLICSNNGINTLSLNDMPNLEHLEYAYNFSSSLTFSNVPSLKYLDCNGNYYIATLNPSVFPLLEHLNCSYNSLTSINVSGLSSLNYLDCSANQLTSLNVTGLNNLTTLYAFNCSISTIDLSNLPSLTTVYLPNNQLTSLDFTGSTNVSSLNCSYNLLTSLNINGLVNLVYLYCQENQLSALNFAGLTGLYIVQCDHNLLTSLDFTTTTNLQAMSCSYNNLSSINIKNGNPNIDTNSYYSWSQNPILTFVCCDEAKLTAINQILSQSSNVNNGNVVFNSYCSFVPGGYYNTITGQIKLDGDNNGCDASDATQPHIKVNINDGLNQGATFTDAEGNYTFYTPAGNFNISPESENPTWFSFSPATASVFFASANNNTSTQNFCTVTTGVHQDVEVTIEPIDAARPGSDAVYKIVYKNKGNTTVSGSLNFNYNDTLLDFTSATLTPSSQNTGVLNWDYANLLPFENRSFYVTLHVNSPTDTPPVNIGTLLNFTATINPINTDENQGDNTFTYNQLVVGSYFPNSIVCLQGDLVSTIQIGNYLHYRIRFENTGNYLAENVVVKIIIDITKYDISTLEILNSSNPVYTRINGNIVEFIFENINLEAAHGTPPVGGHGDVLFKIRTNDNLVNNDTVLQKAGIYFDYSSPTDTNDAETTFAELNNGSFDPDNSVKIYPNPTNSVINIISDFSIESIELYDIQGRILETHLESTNTSTLDISGKSNGIYFLKIKTESGIKVEKIIKK